MKIIRFALTALAVLFGSAPVLSQASDQPSQAWLEAKDVFAPVNALRSAVSHDKSESKTVTTVRVFDENGKKDLTVFRPQQTESKESFSVTRIRTAKEPQVKSVKLNVPESTNEQTSQTIDQQVARSAKAKLVVLPRVETLSSNFLVGAQANTQVGFATQAYLTETPVTQPEDAGAEGEYIQSEGVVEWSAPVSDYGCCDGCCDTCCSTCKPCCPCIMVAGVEAVFLSPDINGTPVTYEYFEAAATPDTTYIGPAFGQAAMDDLYAAPRVWLGCQGCRWGLVGRYYQFMANENDNDVFDPFVTVPPTEHGWNATNMLEAYAADLELTRNFCLHGCKSQFTFGVRYALIEHHESIHGHSLTDPNTGGLMSAYARRNRDSHGTGLTMSLNSRKPLFPCSCAHWFFNVRGSILWGSTYNEVESEASVLATGGASTFASAGTVDAASIRIDDDLFIGELQAGLQWDFALRCLPAKAFFRTAFEYQYWDAGMGSAASGSFAGFGAPDPGDHRVLASSWAPGLVVDFVGFTIGSGFTW